MKELLRTNDPALLSAVEAALSEAGVNAFVADRNVSVVDGSIGAIPRRVLVVEEEMQTARKALIDAGLGKELNPEKR